MAFDRRRRAYQERLEQGRALSPQASHFVPRERTLDLLHAVLRPGDRVCLEGDNQKQADFLARELVRVDPARIHDLHMVQSTLALPEHVEVFERGIASRLDFAFSGPQAKPLYQLVTSHKARVGAIHTYLELFSRYFLDLIPDVCLLVAEACDEAGNIYTGFNTEDTAMICEAARFNLGIIVVQVEKKLDRLPRVDIPADWIDFIVVTGEPCHIEPLFTRDPARITPMQLLMGMMVLKGIYQPYHVQVLNHGIGFPTAAIELLLPTYGAELGMKGECCTHWALNPHPTMIPAIEAGFVEKIHCFGSEPGMADYIMARGDIFPVGPDGTMRSSRATAHMAGLYAIDLFIGATLQVDRYGNSSTAVNGRIAGFGGAPNLGGTPPGRRHFTEAFRKAGYRGPDGLPYGRKLVVQITPSVSEKKAIPVFVEELDAVEMARQGIFTEPPVMIAGDQVTHIVTEHGIAYLDRCPDLATRMQAVAAIAGDTAVGATLDAAGRDRLRKASIFQTPEDLGIDVATAQPDRLAARSMQDLVDQSGGLYRIPPGLMG